MPFNIPILLTWLRVALIPLVVGVFYLPPSWLPLQDRNLAATVAPIDRGGMDFAYLTGITDEFIEGILGEELDGTESIVMTAPEAQLVPPLNRQRLRFRGIPGANQKRSAPVGIHSQPAQLRSWYRSMMATSSPGWPRNACHTGASLMISGRVPKSVRTEGIGVRRARGAAGGDPDHGAAPGGRHADPSRGDRQ